MEQNDELLPEQQEDEAVHNDDMPETADVPEVAEEAVHEETPAEEEVPLDAVQEETPAEEKIPLDDVQEETPAEEEVPLDDVQEEIPAEEEVSLDDVQEETPAEEEVPLDDVQEKTPAEEEVPLDDVQEETPAEKEVSNDPEQEIMSDQEAAESVPEDSAEIYADMVYGEIQQPTQPWFNILSGNTGYISQEEIQRQQQIEADRRRRRENRILAIFAAMLVTMLGVSVFGIASDLRRSSRELTGADGVAPVILYKNSKPEGANELSNFQDENGRYTTEGAAAAVRESIVEIYTYSDSMRKNLVGTGSGVVITDDGYIVTNAHVLQADGYHSVHTTDNRVFSAKVIGRDAKTDIAVIKVSGVKLTPAVLGDSDEVLVGEQVIAVGNPAGLSSTVTDGIVSAVNRKIRGDSTGFEMNCIQTNADISPGNSGGALVNMYGQVIGITSSKYVSSSYEGLGFAITINDAGPIIEELIKNGYISGRFRIGITMIDMSTDNKRQLIEEDLGFELPEDFEGIYITDIDKDFDIANTDLKPGDFITKIDDDEVHTYDDLQSVIRSRYAPGDTVTATCAHVDEDGDIDYYTIKFVIKEDTSGDF